MTLLIRTEPEKNLNRWYSVCVQPTLLDFVAVVCAWGRRHTSYQRVRILPAESPEIAKEIAVSIVIQKTRRGCSVKLSTEAYTIYNRVGLRQRARCD